MDIEKTALNSNIETFYEWIKTNALGVYFDEITLDSSSGGNVVCKTDGIDFLEFFNDPSNSNGGIKVCNKNGNTTRFKAPYSTYDYGYGYKLSGGLMISFNYQSRPQAPSVAITKDDSGNTVIISDASLMGLTSEFRMGIFNTNSLPLDMVTIYNTVTKPNKASLTSMCPFVVCGQEANYTPDVFYTPFTQYTGETVYAINGTKYLSNGIFAMKV